MQPWKTEEARKSLGRVFLEATKRRRKNTQLKGHTKALANGGHFTSRQGNPQVFPALGCEGAEDMERAWRWALQHVCVVDTFWPDNGKCLAYFAKHPMWFGLKAYEGKQAAEEQIAESQTIDPLQPKAPGGYASTRDRRVK